MRKLFKKNCDRFLLLEPADLKRERSLCDQYNRVFSNFVAALSATPFPHTFQLWETTLRAPAHPRSLRRLKVEQGRHLPLERGSMVEE